MDSKVTTYVQTGQQPAILNYNKFSAFSRAELIFKPKDVSSPKVLNDFLPLFADQAQYRGVQYGMTFISSARLLFYNKDIFPKAGVSGTPASWAEVEDAAKKIKKAGDIPL